MPRHPSIPDPLGLLAREVPMMRNLLRKSGEALDTLLAADPPAREDWAAAEVVLEEIEDGGYVTKREA